MGPPDVTLGKHDASDKFLSPHHVLPRDKARYVGEAVAMVVADCIDRDSGQLLSGSFMDYAIPRAHDLLSFTTEISEVLSPTNPLGVRASGEGGTTPALAVVVNAVVDALAEFGVKHMEMPVTPERVWRETSRGRVQI